MNTQYERYGDEWEAEVMKNSKLAITGMLRNVAKERDALTAEHKHRFVTCTWCGWRLDYEADGVEAARTTANEHALHCKADPRTAELATLRDLLYEFQNNPNIELGEIGHEKIEAALKAGQA